SFSYACSPHSSLPFSASKQVGFAIQSHSDRFFSSRTIILEILFLVAFAWVSILLILVLAARLEVSESCLKKCSNSCPVVQCLNWDISKNFMTRLGSMIFTVVAIYAIAQVNVVRVRAGW